MDEKTIIQLIQEGSENRDEVEGDEEGNELPVVSAKEGLKALEKSIYFCCNSLETVQMRLGS